MARKKCISDDTLELVELKCIAFQRWQEHRLNVEKRKEYRALCKRVKQALRADKEKCIEEEMKVMEGDIKCHRQGNFFRRMRKLMNSRVIRTPSLMRRARPSGTLRRHLPDGRDTSQRYSMFRRKQLRKYYHS